GADAGDEADEAARREAIGREQHRVERISVEKSLAVIAQRQPLDIAFEAHAVGHRLAALDAAAIADAVRIVAEPALRRHGEHAHIAAPDEPLRTHAEAQLSIVERAVAGILDGI